MDPSRHVIEGPEDTNAPKYLAATWPFAAVAAGFIGVRLWAKLQPGRGLWWDDYMLVASWFSMLAQCIAVTSGIQLGFGRRIEELPPENIGRVVLYCNLMSACFSLLAAAWSKTAFALSLQRISKDCRCILIFSRFVVISVNFVMFISILSLFLLCQPVEKAWNPTLKGKCLPVSVSTNGAVGASVFSGLMELVLAFMPWQIVRNLDIQWKEKVGIAMTMSMGFIAGIAAFVKCKYVVEYTQPGHDYSYDTFSLIFSSTIECTLTMTASCIPVLRVLVRDASLSGISWLPYPSRNSPGKMDGSARMAGRDTRSSMESNSTMGKKASGVTSEVRILNKVDEEA